MSYLQKLCILASILINTLSYAQNDSTQQIEWDTITKDDYNISYPNNWYTTESNNKMIEVQILDSLDSEKDYFKDNINIVKEKFKSTNFSLKKYTELALNIFEKQFSKSKILSNELKDADGENPYHEVIHEIKNGKLKLKIKQLIYVKNRSAYIITFTSTKKDFDAKIDEADKIIGSFEFNEI